MKIALLITGLGMGGAEKQVCDLADRFAMQNHEVLILYLFGNAILTPKDSTISVVGFKMKKTPLSFITTYLSIRKVLQEFKPDIVHSHMVHANFMTRLIRLSLKMPRLICTAHNTNEGGRMRMWFYRITDPLCELSTNVSQEAVDVFVAKKAVPKNKMITVYNGIDTDRFRFDENARMTFRSNANIVDRTKLLLCVGRLHVQKDYPNMLQAFALALAKNHNLILWIVGDGEEKESLVELCQKLNITNKVSFLGVRHDIPELMSACDLFCLSSAFEGFGLVVAEAMACERPVVATDCGGVKEVVAEDGVLVPPNSPEGLAQGIEKALQLSSGDNYVRTNAARQRILQYLSLDTIAYQWLNIYSNSPSETL